MQRGAPPAPLATVLVVLLLRPFPGVPIVEVFESETFVPSSRDAAKVVVVVAAVFDDEDDDGHVGTPEERPAFSSRLSMFWVYSLNSCPR